MGAQALLDGSQSSAAAHDPLTYLWTLVAKPTGSNAAFTGGTTATPTLVPDAPGAYLLSLVVNGGKVNSQPAAVTYTCTGFAAAPPFANAGPDQTVKAGSLVLGLVDYPTTRFDGKCTPPTDLGNLVWATRPFIGYEDRAANAMRTVGFLVDSLTVTRQAAQP